VGGVRDKVAIEIEKLPTANLLGVHCRVTVAYVVIPVGLQGIHLDLLPGVQRRTCFDPCNRPRIVYPGGLGASVEVIGGPIPAQLPTGRALLDMRGVSVRMADRLGR
jgi:hypothetical protein